MCVVTKCSVVPTRALVSAAETLRLCHSVMSSSVENCSHLESGRRVVCQLVSNVSEELAASFCRVFQEDTPFLDYSEQEEARCSEASVHYYQSARRHTSDGYC